MAWKNNPKIRELEPYARKYGYRFLVVLGVSDDGESYDVTSYGTNTKNCRDAELAGKELDRLIQDGVFVV